MCFTAASRVSVLSFLVSPGGTIMVSVLTMSVSRVVFDVYCDLVCCHVVGAVRGAPPRVGGSSVGITA